MCVLPLVLVTMYRIGTTPQQEGREFAHSHNCLFAETSAKTGEGVQRLFELLAHEAAARFFSTTSAGGGGDHTEDVMLSSEQSGGFKLHCVEHTKLLEGGGGGDGGTGSGQRKCCS